VKLINILPARNEAWVIGASLRALMHWVDEAIVLVHASTDATLEICHEAAAEYPGRIRILVEPEATWRERAHRQRLLEAARDRRATHISTLDADEILTGDLLPTIRERIQATPFSRHAGIKMFNLHRSLDCYRSDKGIWGAQAGTMVAFTDSPDLSWQSDGYDHHHRHPHGSRYWRKITEGGIMHLQFASWRRLTAKHAWYKMTERVRWPRKPVEEIDKLYSMALDESGKETEPCPAEWWAPYADLPAIDLNAEPWQEAECRRMFERYGPEAFEGLNLFGVIQEVTC